MESIRIFPFEGSNFNNGYFVTTDTYIKITSGEGLQFETTDTFRLIGWKGLSTILVQDKHGNIFELPYSPQNTKLAYRVVNIPLSPPPNIQGHYN